MYCAKVYYYFYLSDIYKHWIQNVYKKKFADAPHKDNGMREMSKFYYYAGKKLADLKETSREKVTDENTKKKRRQSSDDKRKSKKNKSSEEIDEQSEEDAGEDEENQFYDYSPEISS